MQIIGAFKSGNSHSSWLTSKVIQNPNCVLLVKFLRDTLTKAALCEELSYSRRDEVLQRE